MPPFLDSYREQITALCLQYGVRRLDAFGSAVQVAQFDNSRSDIDLLVQFEPAADEGGADRYFGLLEDLGRLFGRPVDLVVERAIRNPYFKKSIDESRQLIYASASAA